MNLKKISKENIYFFFFILLFFIIDRIVKIKIINALKDLNSIWVNKYLNFELVWNSGIGFGLLSLEANIFYHFISFLIILVIFFLFFLFFKSSNLDKMSYSLIIGGALGNLYDRIIYYSVPDFIDLHVNDFHWFTFNIADIFITLGVVSILLSELLIKKKMYKKLVILSLLTIITSSCNSLGEAGKVLRNEKISNTDEFLIEKNKPLIIPPNIDELPAPEKAKKIEKNKNIFSSSSSASNKKKSSPSSVEKTILNEIKN